MRALSLPPLTRCLARTPLKKQKQKQNRYQKAWQILDAAAGAPVLTPEERRWVEGGALAALLQGAWGGGGV
jgi:hypothetical protein